MAFDDIIQIALITIIKTEGQNMTFDDIIQIALLALGLLLIFILAEMLERRNK